MCNWIKLYNSDGSNIDSRYIDADNYANANNDEKTNLYGQPATVDSKNIAVSFDNLKKSDGTKLRWVSMAGNSYLSNASSDVAVEAPASYFIQP